MDTLLRFKSLIGVACLAIFLVACNQNKSSELINPGYDYYPLAKGNYVVYDVKNTVYNVIGTVDTFTYQLKELISDTNTAVNGASDAFKIIRYKRNLPTDEWVLDSVWQVWRNNNVLVKNENGISFIKLTFPLKNGLKWNGNTFNNREAETYESRMIVSYVNGKYFDNIAAIVAKDSLPINYVNRDFRVEYYAKNVGLVYKEWQTYIYDQASLGQFNIETGSHYVQQISTYGKE
jgi:hypothetical protein